MNLEDFELIYKENRCIIKDKQDVKSKLAEIVGDSNVSDDEIDIFSYGLDSTLMSLHWRLQGKIAGLPDFITWPESVEQISEILKLANSEKIPVIPYAEGSGVVGGAISIFGGIVLDMKKFNKVLSINDKDLTVTCETGINGMNLERYLNAKGYTGGHIPQSVYTSSVGGYIAHRAAGQFSTKYGKIEDIVLGMELVLPNGEIINFKTVPRASTGPQLDKLFIGAEGTYGIVTKATLKIWPYPEKRALVSYAFPTLEDSFEACRQILREQIYPAVIRIYDADETARHFADIENAKDRVMVIFVCEGIERLVKLEEIITKEKCEKNSGVDCGEKPVEHWIETRFKVTESSMLPTFKIVFDTIEVASLWENSTAVYYKVVEEMKKIKGLLIITAHVSHFYPNGVGIYFSWGGVPPKEKSDFEFYQECWDTTEKAVIDAGGSIAHHHGIGINRAHWMDEEFGSAIKLMRDIKNLIDPNYILNPGKTYFRTWKERKEEGDV
jgi:alkyldihydroxyacetonephosphate synthase